ncbi:MAG TPA: MerR family transcriptional regulator [Oscillatoriaceae cyanobacterium]
MTTGPIQDPPALLSLEAVAEGLDLPESTIREWLASFNWERRYDGAGHLYLSPRDIGFLRVIKALKELDRSCDSIVRVISTEDLDLEVVAADPEAALSVAEASLQQVETLKAELKALHARPAKKPFWKFWA